jgi:hypothetical protein
MRMEPSWNERQMKDRAEDGNSRMPLRNRRRQCDEGLPCTTLEPVLTAVLGVGKKMGVAGRRQRRAHIEEVDEMSS